MISGCLRYCHIYLWNQRVQLYHICPEHLLDVHRGVYECPLGDEMSQPLPFEGERLPPKHSPIIHLKTGISFLICSIKISLVRADIYRDYCRALI